MRPLDKTSIVAGRFASVTGWWYGNCRTAVPRMIRLVAAAMKPKHVSESINESDGSIAIEPSVAPGYRATCSGR
jgi:hypothetical protein